MLASCRCTQLLLLPLVAARVSSTLVGRDNACGRQDAETRSKHVELIAASKFPSRPKGVALSRSSTARHRRLQSRGRFGGRR
jgi:hypothetical protein